MRQLCRQLHNIYLELLEVDGRHDEGLPGVRGGLADPDPRLLRVLTLRRARCPLRGWDSNVSLVFFFNNQVIFVMHSFL